MSAIFSVGEFTAAFGAAFNDGQALLNSLANQNAQWDVTQTPVVWAQTASVFGFLATSAQALQHEEKEIHASISLCLFSRFAGYRRLQKKRREERPCHKAGTIRL